MTASVPGDFAEYEVNFSIDGQNRSYYMTTPRGQDSYFSKIEVNGLARHRQLRFTVQPEQPERFLHPYFEFQQIDNGAGIKRTSRGEKGVLRAKIQGIDPRAGNVDLKSKSIVVTCQYSYEI